MNWCSLAESYLIVPGPASCLFAVRWQLFKSPSQENKGNLNEKISPQIFWTLFYTHWEFFCPVLGESAVPAQKCQQSATLCKLYIDGAQPAASSSLIEGKKETWPPPSTHSSSTAQEFVLYDAFFKKLACEWIKKKLFVNCHSCGEIFSISFSLAGCALKNYFSNVPWSHLPLAILNIAHFHFFDFLNFFPFYHKITFITRTRFITQYSFIIT